VNGMRTRSNNFHDRRAGRNDPSVTGRQQPLNNTDLIQEVRLITNQFAAGVGRAAGSVDEVVTKERAPTSSAGSAFVFRNRMRSKRDQPRQAAGRTDAPFLEDTQYGGTLGGPDRQESDVLLRSYSAGRPTSSAPDRRSRRADGSRAGVLQSTVGSLPQIQALLKFLTRRPEPLNRSVSYTYGGNTYSVPIGSLMVLPRRSSVNIRRRARGHQLTASGRHILLRAVSLQ